MEHPGCTYISQFVSFGLGHHLFTGCYIDQSCRHIVSIFNDFRSLHVTTSTLDNGSLYKNLHGSIEIEDFRPCHLPVCHVDGILVKSLARFADSFGFLYY